jgi:opacity protein-like surface antigen
LPILVKFNILNKLQVYTGPELSYVVDQNTKDITNGPISIESSSKTSFDIALSAGVSFYFIKNLGIDLRYNYGLLDLRKPFYIPGVLIDPGLAGQQVLIDYEEYNWSFQVGFKYRFKIKD